MTGTGIPGTQARHAVSRVVLVADRGLLSLDNLDQQRQITLPTGKPLEFVLAVPAARSRVNQEASFKVSDALP